MAGHCDNVNEMGITFPAHSNSEANYKMHDTISQPQRKRTTHICIVNSCSDAIAPVARCFVLFWMCYDLPELRVPEKRFCFLSHYFKHIIPYYVVRILIWNYLVLFCVFFFSCFVLCNATTMGHPANAVMMIDDGVRSEKMNAKKHKTFPFRLACRKCRPQIRLAELQTNTGPFSTTIRDPNVIYTKHFMYATTFRNPLSRNKYVVRNSHH